MSKEDLVSTLETYVVLTLLLPSLPACESPMAPLLYPSGLVHQLEGKEPGLTSPVLYPVTCPAEHLVAH